MAKFRISNRAARRAAQREAQGQAAPTSAPPMQPASSHPAAAQATPTQLPADPVEALAHRLAAEYNAKGSLELLFCRKIAGAEFTYNSLQTSLNEITHASDPEGRTRDRLTRVQARVLRSQVTALNELKALQDRRNIVERFPDQTRDCAKLANHTPFIGDAPQFAAIHPILNGKLRGPLDHTPVTNTEAAKRTPPHIMKDLEDLLSSAL